MRLRAGNSEPTAAGFDVTFSAPKPISVLFAVGLAEVSAALIECHEEAVRSALGYLEETAVFVRGGDEVEHRSQWARDALAERPERRTKQSAGTR
jgi:conjugative relaxase-like TrwC/TraI family protein